MMALAADAHYVAVRGIRHVAILVAAAEEVEASAPPFGPTSTN